MWERIITHANTTDGYWAGQSYFSDTLLYSSDPAIVKCSLVTAVFTRTTPAGTREDVLTCTAALAKIGGGGVYSSLSGADMANAETDLNSWWTSQKGYTSNQCTLAEWRWHEVSAAIDKHGPAVRVTSVGVAGTLAASRMPDQVSATVTARTASRKHWGRVYLPMIGWGSTDTAYGRLSNASCDAIAGYWRTLALALDGRSIALGVWSPVGKAFLTTDEIHVDNVYDVQRRRRAKQASYRKSYAS